MLTCEGRASVLQLLTDIETLRRSYRLYPDVHPALQSAKNRLVNSLEKLDDDAENTISCGPDRVFWNGEDLTASATSPALRLAQILFHLGFAGVHMQTKSAAASLLELTRQLSTLREPPGEKDRQQLLSCQDELKPGIELIALDLSGVQFIEAGQEASQGGSRFILSELAARLSRDGAFPLAGKIAEGEMSAGIVADLVANSEDPESLFDYLFYELSIVITQGDERQRRMRLLELREFLGELVRLVDPERSMLTVNVAARHLPLEGDPREALDPLFSAETILDAVELMLVQQVQVPEVVQRVVYKMAAPLDEQKPVLSADVVARARALLTRLPGTLAEPSFFATPSGPHIEVSWASQSHVHELITSLDEKGLRSHFVTVLQETASLWPDQTEGELASLRLAEEFVAAIEMGDFETAQSLPSVLAGTRHPEAKKIGFDGGVQAIRKAFKTHDRSVHPVLVAMLASLGEQALPGLLDALADEQDKEIRNRLIEAIKRHGEKAIVFIKPTLDDPRWFAVRNAIFLLRHFGDHSSVPTLKNRLADAHPRVHAEILKTLVSFQDPQWMLLLMRSVDNPAPQIRTAALEVAAKITHPQVVKALSDRLRQRFGNSLKEEFTLELIEALGELRQPGTLPVLSDLLKLKQWRFRFPLAPIRRAAAEAVTKIETVEARQLAKSLINDSDKELALAVRQALASVAGTKEDE